MHKDAQRLSASALDHSSPAAYTSLKSNPKTRQPVSRNTRTILTLHLVILTIDTARLLNL